ncbi:putative translation initiation factor eIF-2B subunit epsilon [Erysiphe neolycopersici]|uniref:Mannose-1-phosphate guanyltransferase n=1 Tax=Erysiphe neolycopersici TaxID=212602 RepID=A0A420HZK4_9PEZI|nr:putative translation initiation factor eIF-2B subunit epsilon [Erysiphe neolycopersici]
MNMKSSKSTKSSAKGGKQGAKSKKTTTSGKKVDDDREETLQAVILADFFKTRFAPFTLETPRCLLPLANTALLEYTLEFLAMSGVADIYIYCGAHASIIEDYIQESRWNPDSPTSPFQVLKTVKTSARSIGDAMRDLDSRNLIKGDFLIVYGDLISNFPIDKALKMHRARNRADKNAIMTMVLRTAGRGTHRTAVKGVTPVFVVDPKINRCLHYEEIHPLQVMRYINIDPKLLKAHPEIEIRSDLIDCGIDICTPDVLALWAESFDFELPRRDFLNGVLKDFELHGKMIYTEIIDNYYAARVSNLQMYESVSKDILGRWTYPFVPDSNLVTGQTYKYEKGRLCKENGVILARTCKVGKRTVLGMDTVIDDAGVIENSIIGRRCQIGKNVTIKNAYIWDDVKVGDGSLINRAIVANRCVIGKNCNIKSGALISFGVRIGDGIVVKEGQRITRSPRTNYDDNFEISSYTALSDPTLVGEDGEGHICDEDSDEDEEYTLNSSLIYNIAHINLSDSSISTLASKLSEDEAQPSDIRHSSFNGSIISSSDPSSQNESFHNDAVNGILDTLKEYGDFDSAKLELMGLRLSTDATDQQVCRAIAVAFVKRVLQLMENENLEAIKAVKCVFDTSGAEKFFRDVGIGSDRQIDSQIQMITYLQKDLTFRPFGSTILAAMSQNLYSRDILEEDAFLRWWNHCETMGQEETEKMTKVREKTGIFIEWLKQAESESSSDDESDKS